MTYENTNTGRPLLLSATEVCRQLNIGRTTLWRLTKAGELPIVRIGRRSLLRQSDVDRVAAQGASVETTA